MAVLELTIIRGTDSAGKTLDNITIKTGSTRESGKLTYYTVYWQRNINDKNWGTTQLATNLKLELNMASISFRARLISDRFIFQPPLLRYARYRVLTPYMLLESLIRRVRPDGDR